MHNTLIRRIKFQIECCKEQMGYYSGLDDNLNLKRLEAKIKEREKWITKVESEKKS